MTLKMRKVEEVEKYSHTILPVYILPYYTQIINLTKIKREVFN